MAPRKRPLMRIDELSGALPDCLAPRPSPPAPAAVTRDEAMLAANLGMLLVALSWGTMIPSMKHLLLGWDPYFMALARYGLAVPPMLLLLRLTERDVPWFAGFAPWRWWVLGTIGIGIF